MMIICGGDGFAAGKDEINRFVAMGSGDGNVKANVAGGQISNRKM